MRCTGWLTRAAGEAGWLAGWEIVTHAGPWHGRYVHTYFPTTPHFCCTHWSYWTLWSFTMSIDGIGNTTYSINPPPGESQLFHPFIHYWHMLVPEWPPWKNQMHKALLQKWLTTEWFTFKVMVKIFSPYYGSIPQFLSWESINVGQEYSSLSTSLIPPNCMSKYPWVRYWTLSQPNASIRVWMLG